MMMIGCINPSRHYAGDNNDDDGSSSSSSTSLDEVPSNNMCNTMEPPSLSTPFDEGYN
jgi:hypothetical protein